MYMDIEKYIFNAIIFMKEADSMYCPKCGTSNENSSCYCFSCGTALGSNAVESSVSSPVSSTSQTDTFYSGVSPEVSSAPPIKKSRKKTVLTFVFTGMFLIIIALAAALFFFLSDLLIK